MVYRKPTVAQLDLIDKPGSASVGYLHKIGPFWPR